MENKLYLYNTITRQKELFKPLVEGKVGLYVCGPTVYGDPHMGHGRAYTFFDILHRYFKFFGFKVRYVRNITDVGHLENDADEGEDKIAKKAKLEQLEPMEVAQFYTDSFNKNMQDLNILNPSIQPRASGHIIEQIEMIQKIINNGLAYVSNGSVYFDVLAYNEHHKYGELSGRILDDLIAGAGSERRELKEQAEKKNSFDFALWKKASPEHIMRWNSPWGEGFPGWHIECSAMSVKYLGDTFDIHGGGMDLLFPHHECEIAQNKACNHTAPARYWVHNNMITINGQKMGKSLGNFITLNELFSGEHKILERAYSPMVLRFFILQAHYRSTLDFSNEALQAAEKGMNRLLIANKTLQNLKASAISSIDVSKVIDSAFDALHDDLNTPIMIAQLFELVRIINLVNDGKESLTANDIQQLKSFFKNALFDLLGLVDEQQNSNENVVDELMQLIIDLRLKARLNKDYATSDQVRDSLQKANIQLKDSKEGTTWNYTN